jgi:hypothetical protein
MNMGDISSFCSLLQSLFSMLCSSPFRRHLHPLLSLFLVFDFFETIVNGIVFQYSFLICLLVVYRKTTDFCKLILHSATLLKVFMVSRSFGVEFFGS